MILVVWIMMIRCMKGCTLEGVSTERRTTSSFSAGTSPMEMFPRCRAEFHTPCSINWVWWLVNDLTNIIETSDEIEEILRNTSLGVYNRQFNFWPEIIDYETGIYVASGAPDTLESRIGRTIDQVLSAEAPIDQSGLWSYIKEQEDNRYFEFIAKDNYHTDAINRIGYYKIACKEIQRKRIVDATGLDENTFGGNNNNRTLAIIVAFSHRPANDVTASCDSRYSELCSIEYAALVNGAITATILRSETENDLRLIFYDIAQGNYNRKYSFEQENQLCLEDGCFSPFIIDENGILVSHGMDSVNSYDYIETGTNILESKHFNIESMALLEAPANEGGGFTFFRHNSMGHLSVNGQENVTIGFITGVYMFGKRYYISVPFIHRMADVKLGPYCEACSAFENYPCGWKNARTLLGYQQAMLLASPIDNNTSFDEAWLRIVEDESYAISTRGWKDFYAFAYDFNGTCVAHGRIPQFVGRNVTTNLYPFIGGKGIDIWDLHLQWIEASKTDGAAAIRYPWVDDNAEIFDKVVYVIQIARNGHNYYIAVGLGEAQPAVPTFAQAQHGYISSEYRSFDDDRYVQTLIGFTTFFLATAQNVQQYKAALGNLSQFSYPTRNDLLDQGYSDDDLRTWWDNTTNPYTVLIYSEATDSIIIYDMEPAYIGLSLSDLGTATDTGTISLESMNAGEWQDFTVSFRKKLSAETSQHFLFYDTLEIADHIYDGLLDGVGERLHMGIFIRDREAPSSAAILDGGCSAIDGVLGLHTDIPGDQCTCPTSPGAQTLWPTEKNWTAHGVDDSLDLSCYDGKQVVSKLLEFYSMDCDTPLFCDAGAYYDTDLEKCIPCPAGTYRLDTSVHSCVPCPLGTATARTGQIQCTECGSQEYADETGLVSCKSCPLNTERYVSQIIQPLGTSIDDCLCQLGVCDEAPCKLPYRVEEIILSMNHELDYAITPNSTLPKANWPRPETGAYITGYRESTGQQCEECPEGAICLGGTNPPFPRMGYSGAKWGEIIGIGANYEYKGVSRQDLQNKWHNRIKFTRCEGENKGQDRCKANFRCHRKRRRQNQLMCWAIKKGRVELFGEEWQCPSSRFSQWLLTIFMFVAAIIVFLFLNVLLGSFTAMDIFLYNTRSMSIIKDFNLSWPLDEKWLFSLDKWFTFLDISQIDVEIVEPTCVTNTTFLLHVVTQSCLLVLEVIFYFGNAFYTFFTKGRSLDHDDRRSLFSKAISRTLSATTMMYPTLADVGFRGFGCREFGDGQMYLIADLDVRCWDTKRHKTILILCSLLTAMVFAYPVAIWLKLRELNHTNRLHDPVALERYGLIYEGFKLENYQWGVFQLFKALVLSIIQGCLPTRPTMQVFASLNFLIFSVACHFYYNPFLHRKSDYLEAFFLFATCIFIGIGSTFNTLDSEDSDNAVEHVLYGLLHLLLFTCVGVSLRAVYVDIRERKLTAQSRARLRTLVNQAREIEYFANQKENGLDGDIKTFKKYTPTEIHGTLKPEPLHKFVRSIHSSSTPNLRMSFGAHFSSSSSRRNKITRHDSTDTSSRSISDSDVKKNYSPTNLAQLQLLRDIGEVDEWFAPALSDVGVASVFSNAEEAIFWRRLDLALPDLFEFLSLAPAENVVRLKMLIGQLIAADVHIHHERPNGARRIGYRDLIAKEDRGALLRGLILTDEGHRKQFFRILDALAAEKLHRISSSNDARLRKGASSRIPLGYERGSGRHMTSSARRALRMTSTHQPVSNERLLSSSSLPPYDTPHDTSIDIQFFESPKGKSNLIHPMTDAADLEQGNQDTMNAAAIANSNDEDNDSIQYFERAISEVDVERDIDGADPPLSDFSWFVWTQAHSTAALPETVAARSLQYDISDLN